MISQVLLLTHCATSDAAGSGDSSAPRSVSSVKLLARDMSGVCPSERLLTAQMVQRDHNTLGETNPQALATAHA